MTTNDMEMKPIAVRLPRPLVERLRQHAERYLQAAEERPAPWEG